MRVRSEDEPSREALKELLSRRRQLVKQRASERNRLDKGVSAGVRASTERHIRWLDREIERVEKLYKKTLRSESHLSERADLYRSVPGVGELTAATLAAYLPELGDTVSAKELTSLCGLAPWARDSGSQRGYRATRGGRSAVRKRSVHGCFVIGAVVREASDSSTGNCVIGEKPGKVALMRKLLLQLNAVARRRTPWTERYDPTHQTA